MNNLVQCCEDREEDGGVISAGVIFRLLDKGVFDEAHGGEAKWIRRAIRVPAHGRRREEGGLAGQELHLVDFDVAARDGVAAREVDRRVGAELIVRALNVAKGDVADEHGRCIVLALVGVAVELVDDNRVSHVDHSDSVECHMLDHP